MFLLPRLLNKETPFRKHSATHAHNKKNLLGNFFNEQHRKQVNIASVVAKLGNIIVSEAKFVSEK